jgi:alpha-tubulin suppressor-like RCC1 family protein
LTAGLNYTCASLSDGAIYCWGANDMGQLGNGSANTSPPSSSKTTQVVGLTGGTGVAAGYVHTCAVVSDGTARCWGMNDKGQLGDGTRTSSFQPVVVAGLTNVVQISAGAQHSCALLVDGSARCWGYNYQGQLGNGSTTDSPIPTPVSSQSKFTAIAAGNIHTCAIVADPGHDVVCWGDNMYGQLGAGQKGARGSLQPIPIVGVSNVRSLAAGDVATCAVLFDGSALCWGGDLTPNAPPYAVILPVGVASLASRYRNGCVIMSDRSAACWGYDDTGQLGNGTKMNSSTTTPVVVTGLSDVTAIATGSNHSCASTRNGSLYCWGLNTSGQAGGGSATALLTPAPVAGLP